MRDHALNDNTVVIELTVDLPVFIGEFSAGWLLRGDDEPESLVAFISENIVRIEKPIQSRGTGTRTRHGVLRVQRR